MVRIFAVCILLGLICRWTKMCHADRANLSWDLPAITATR